MESNDNNEEMCGICGDLLNQKFVYKLPCNHTFHYECIYKSLVHTRSTCNKCPYCRQTFETLEPVNGLKDLKYTIHYLDKNNKPEYTNVKCEHIMTRGKNKGNKCGKNCQLGYFRCGLHNNGNKNDKDTKEIKT
tara:strand:- start:2148 stop:2549 length:402 start_codon:yes stop_codon:yes gene_type:complete